MDRVEEITVEDLKTEIRNYEAFYGISTERLLSWIANRDKRLETIEDAGFWRSSYDLLKRLEEAPGMPEAKDEDPNRDLVLFSCRVI